MTAATLARTRLINGLQNAGPFTRHLAAPSEVRIAFPTDLGWMALRRVAAMPNEPLRVTQLSFGQPTPIAALSAVGGGTEPQSLESIDKSLRELVRLLEQFAQGKRVSFRNVAVDYGGATPFQRRVLELCQALEWGETSTYADLARLAGSPGAARAVGNVMAGNRLPIIVPCHRVLGSAGKLGGYSAPGGLETKRRLLEQEK